jgi:hypothetical protein
MRPDPRSAHGGLKKVHRHPFTPELDTLEKGIAAIGHGEVCIIPASAETSGHGTTGSQAALYADRLAEFLARPAKGVTLVLPGRT